MCIRDRNRFCTRLLAVKRILHSQRHLLNSIICSKSRRRSPFIKTLTDYQRWKPNTLRYTEFQQQLYLGCCQPRHGTCSVSVVCSALSCLSFSLRISIYSFRYVSTCLGNQLPSSFCKPFHNQDPSRSFLLHTCQVNFAIHDFFTLYYCYVTVTSCICVLSHFW